MFARQTAASIKEHKIFSEWNIFVEQFVFFLFFAKVLKSCLNVNTFQTGCLLKYSDYHLLKHPHHAASTAQAATAPVSCIMHLDYRGQASALLRSIAVPEVP